MQHGEADLATAIVGPALLEALAAEDVGRVEVGVGILGTADPAELVLTLATGQMVAAFAFLLDYESALGTVRHLLCNAIDGEVLSHGRIQLAPTVTLRVVGQATPDADLVAARLTNSVIGVPPIEPVRLDFEVIRLKAF